MTQFQCGKPADLTAQGLSPAWTNLADFFEYTAPRTINMMKHARPWEDAADVYSRDDLLTGGYITSGGTIISLPGGVTSLRSYVYLYTGYIEAYVASANLAFMNDTMTLSYDGSATVTVTGPGVSGQAYTSNGATFTFSASTSNAQIVLTVTPTNPADYPRNWELIPDSLADEYAAGQVFRPDMIADLAVFDGVRFMNWGNVNSSAMENWADRTLLTDEYWTGYMASPLGVRRRGLPIEAMTKFCEEADKHGWFCLPHAATDAYATSMAECLLANMPTDKMVFVEYSNETWNPQFDQFDYCEDEGVSLFGAGTARWDEYSAYRSTQMAGLFRAIYAAVPNRLRVVMGTQTSSAAVTSRRLAAGAWLTASPGDWIDPKTVHDYLAITGYFGNAVLEDNAAAIVTEMGVSQAAAITLILDTYCVTDVATTKVEITDQCTLARAASIKICMYENNQHLNANQADATSLYSGGNPIAGLIDMMEAIYQDARTEAFKAEILTHFKMQGGAFSTYYFDYGSTNQYGGWYWKRYMGDTTTGSTGLAAWVAANPRWFHY